MTIQNEKDLGKALKDEQDTIVIEGDLKKKVIKIKATGSVAWAVAIGAIAVSVTAIILAPTPEPGTKALGIIAAPVAVGILGAGTTITAITIAVAAGGVGALSSLRKYKIVEDTDDKVILKRA